MRLTINEYAARENVTRETVHSWIKKGKLLTEKTPSGRTRILGLKANNSNKPEDCQTVYISTSIWKEMKVLKIPNEKYTFLYLVTNNIFVNNKWNGDTGIKKDSFDNTYDELTSIFETLKEKGFIKWFEFKGESFHAEITDRSKYVLTADEYMLMED